MADKDQDFKFNVEAWHEEWLKSYERLSTDYFRSVNAGVAIAKASSDVILVEFSMDDEDGDLAIFNCLGSFRLPLGSAGLIDYMAKFCRVSMMPPDEIVDSPFELTDFPDATFLLSSLLEASFPKNTRSGVFRGHNGGTLIGYEKYEEAREDLGDDAALACAFAGLGVTLMNACRPLVDPSAPDSEIIQKGENIYLCILGDEPGEEEEEE